MSIAFIIFFVVATLERLRFIVLSEGKPWLP